MPPVLSLGISHALAVLVYLWHIRCCSHARAREGSTHMQPSVIVVDDEPPLVDLVCDVLNDEGIAAKPCPHGHEAHPCIRREQPKAVILDIQMPEVDGIQLFYLLRSDPATAHIPVIFFTANANHLLRRYPNYDQLGATLIRKPFHVEELIDVVTQTLEKQGN
jgi:CheY-like chemotaxis protein